MSRVTPVRIRVGVRPTHPYEVEAGAAAPQDLSARQLSNRHQHLSSSCRPPTSATSHPSLLALLELRSGGLPAVPLAAWVVSCVCFPPLLQRLSFFLCFRERSCAPPLRRTSATGAKSSALPPAPGDVGCFLFFLRCGVSTGPGGLSRGERRECGGGRTARAGGCSRAAAGTFQKATLGIPKTKKV